MIGKDVILNDGNKLVKEKGKRLWSVLKKRGCEGLPHGIQVDVRNLYQALPRGGLPAGQRKTEIGLSSNRGERTLLQGEDELRTSTYGPENRILKRALLKTLGSSTDTKNRKGARRLLDYFDGITESHAVAKDFAEIIYDRKNGHYHKAIGWARLLLNDLNVSNTTGTADTQSLLFSMDQLFESCVEHVIQHRLGREWDISL